MPKTDQVAVSVMKIPVAETCGSNDCKNPTTYIIITQAIGAAKIYKTYAVHTCDDHLEEAFESLKEDADNFVSKPRVI